MSQENSYNDIDNNVAPFIGISRHRLDVDGEGVTTLVAFQGCPLRCKYCLNIHCWQRESIRFNLTPEELFEKVKIDNLYFRATKGGICFGGGEPAQFPEFIKRFRELTPSYWKITLETSLNVPKENITSLLDAVDLWIIDIKDMNPEIYKSYTTKDNTLVLENLELLPEAKAKCLIRVPLIPSFNTVEDCKKSIHKLKEIGFRNFDHFKYIVRQPSHKNNLER